MSATAQTIGTSACSKEEWDTRVHLAALYRAFDHYGFTDLIYTHISARVPGEKDQYLINPYGLMFDEVKASNLLKVDFDGNVLSGDFPYNQAGHLIHTAALKARPEINFALHTHTRAGVAVSAMPCGVLPISQHSNLILGTIAYHEYAQVTSDDAECDRIARDLSDKYLMMMHNHGILAVGRSAAEAFHYLYYLEMSCKIQVDVLQAGQGYLTPDPAAVKGLSESGMPKKDEPRVYMAWEAILRMLDRKDATFRE